MNKRVIYLDNSATTRVDNEVLSAMNQYHIQHYGNPSSLHKMGFISEKAMEEARNQIAAFLKVSEKTIFFVSGGTEGNNLAIIGAIQKNKHTGNKIITSKIEHPSVLEVFKQYESQGYQVSYLDVDEKGLIYTEQLEDVLDENTIFISIMKVNNEIGIIQDMKKISSIVRKKAPHCIIHSDCVQALGKISFYPAQEGVDIITFSAHKFHGPKGVGGIYIDSQLKLKPFLFGGGQEKGFRSGTENVAGIVGMGKAIQLIRENSIQTEKHFYKLKNHCINRMSEEIKEIRFNSQLHGFAPHILNISIENIKGETILHMLEDKGIYISTGSACSSRKKSQSHVLKSIGLDSKMIEGSLRISFCKDNTLGEINEMVNALKETISFLKRYTRR
ncbi:MAG: cysteine desulfurase family protein [Eubacteriales bacterium]